MTEHLSKSILEHFPDRSMSASALARVALHLEECRDCDQTWRELGRWRRSREPDELFSETRQVEWCHLDWLADEHLTEADLGRYLQRRLEGDDLEMVELHLRECDHCQARVGPVRSRPSPAEQVGRNWSAWHRLAWGLVGVGILWLAIWLALEPRRRFAGMVSKRNVPDEDQGVATGSFNASRDGQALAAPGATPEPRFNQLLPRGGTAPRRSTGQTSNQPTRRPGTRLAGREGQPAAPVLALADGGRTIRLNSVGRLTGLEELTHAERRWIRDILRQEELPDSGVADLQAGEDPRLRAPSTAEPRSPTGVRLLTPLPEVLREAQPVFQWQPHPAAIIYQIEIHEVGGTEVLRSAALGPDTHRWQPARPLRRGSTWVALLRVRIDSAGNSFLSSSPRLFRILGEPERRRLASLRARTSSHLAIGLLSARHGLITEARREIELLAAENPESILIKRFLLRLLAESYAPN